MTSAINAEFPTMGRFAKLPVTIDAYRLPATGEDVPYSFHEWADRMGFINFECDRDEGMLVITLEGQMRADPGDWIIRGVAALTRGEQLDLFAVALYLSSRNDPTCTLNDQNAERAIELLVRLSGFELPAPPTLNATDKEPK